jgi:DNA-binding NarL/FixJ family response regulator
LFDDHALAAEARAVCERCSVLRECRRWALTNAVDGVAGGMTVAAREAWRRARGVPEPQITVEDVMPLLVVSADRRWGRGRSEAILSAVAELTAQGETARQIAARLDVTRRTVCRLRAKCRARDTIVAEEAATA